MNLSAHPPAPVGNPVSDALLNELRALLGEDGVITASEECAYYAQDVYSQGVPAAAVVAPAHTDQLAAVVRTVASAGHALVPRGGGMSYTGGYLPTQAGTVMVDMRRMNRVLELNREDMYVRVEAGITWRALENALRDTGLRTPFWGTLSGRHATVGGGLSQNSIFWGSGRYGTAVDSLLGLDVVLADGTVLRTGSAAQVNALPFFRHYGPDLTGLFAGDCGALGFKAVATLRLVPRQPAQAFGSFAFDRYDDMVPAMSAIARADIATECFGFDPCLQAQRMKRESLARDAKEFVGALKAAGGIGKALREGAKMAAAGRRFMDDVQWSFHVMIEARTEASADAGLKAARDIAAQHRGRELTDSIPRLVRANPFGPLNSMLGPLGERWVPVHGLLPHSGASDAMARIEALFAAHREAMESLGIETGYLLATVSTNCFVIEPVFFWPDAVMEIHRRSLEPDYLKRLRGFAANPEAAEAVATIRGELMDLLMELGAVHLQVGKSYRYRNGLHPANYALVTALKHIVDPDNRINPGSLGLTDEA